MENEKRVFLACRAVFDGNNAQVRKPKAILKVVSQHQQICQTLLNDLGEKNLIGILKNLLERRVFDSDLEAKLAFPDLFTTSAARDLQHNTTEADAAKSEAEALENIAYLEGERNDTLNPFPVPLNSEPRSHIPPPTCQPISSTAVPAQPVNHGIEMPSLYPLYFPYKIQHQVLTKTQRLLEESCYSFTAHWLPELLDQRQWDCPEAIELNKWTHVVVKYLSKLPSHCFEGFDSDPPTSLANILISINTLRHSAVHRLHTTAKGILEMIRSATSFARALRDLTCQYKLEELHQELEGKFRALELNKNFLETRVEREMRDIAEQRKLLEEREQQVLVNMLREDKDYGSLIGSLLSQSVDQIFDKVKEDTSEPSEPEQNSAPVTDEKNEEPNLNDETIHKAKSNFLIEAKFIASQYLELEKVEPSPGHQSLKTAQSAPSSPCTDSEALYESKDSERETRDLVSKKSEAAKEVYGTSPF